MIRISSPLRDLSDNNEDPQIITNKSIRRRTKRLEGIPSRTVELPSRVISPGHSIANVLPFPEFHYTNDGILIPMGHAIPSDARQTSLLYNEYIVYNTDQINMKYLLRADFQYKY